MTLKEIREKYTIYRPYNRMGLDIANKEETEYIGHIKDFKDGSFKDHLNDEVEIIPWKDYLNYLKTL